MAHKKTASHMTGGSALVGIHDRPETGRAGLVGGADMSIGADAFGVNLRRKPVRLWRLFWRWRRTRHSSKNHAAVTFAVFHRFTPFSATIGILRDMDPVRSIVKGVIIEVYCLYVRYVSF